MCFMRHIFAFMCARLCSILVFAHNDKLQPPAWKVGVPSYLAWIPAQNARLTAAKRPPTVVSGPIWAHMDNIL